MTLGELNIWFFLLDEIVLVGIFIVAVSLLIPKSLIRVQKNISSEVKVYLEQTLSKHREKASDMVEEKVGLNIGLQLNEVKEELKQALADKVIAQDAQVTAQYAQVEAEDAQGVAEDAQGVAEDAQGIAEDANQAKTDFLSRMSHEIRTPINGIIGSLDLIDLTTVTPIQAEDIQRAIDSSNRLLSVINEVLNFSSLEAGITDYECEYFDLSNCVGEIIDSLKPLAREKGLLLKLNLDDKLLLEFTDRRGDKQKIGQILTNLIGNAIKFTEQGQILVNIKVLSDKGVRFEIIDTGVGIDEKILPTLFNPFCQGDESTSRDHGGTGLGLSISKKFVQGMKGRIGVESKPYLGSTFWFELDLCSNKCENFPQCNLTNESKKEIQNLDLSSNLNKNIQVLVVDDDEVNRIVARRCLEEIGCKVTDVINGKLALEKFNQNKYELIIMDLQMPKMDGFEASRRIRSIEQENGLKPTPILALSASVLGNIKEECEKSGMDDYIGKPFKKDVLLSKINHLVNPS